MTEKDIDYRILARKFQSFLKSQQDYKELEKKQKPDQDLLFDFNTLTFYLYPDTDFVENTVLLKRGSDLI